MGPLREVWSGGQTGVDRAGWRAAITCGLATGGWMPHGWLAEDGPCTGLAEIVGARECPDGGTEAERYRARTRANVSDCDATIWIGSTDSRGYRATLKAVMDLGKPMVQVTPTGPDSPRNAAVQSTVDQVAAGGWARLNVAGHRASTHPWLGRWAEAFLVEVFRALAARSGGS
jgi:hypothetical protein